MNPHPLARLEAGRADALLTGLSAVLAVAMLVWRGGTLTFPDERDYLALGPASLPRAALHLLVLGSRLAPRRALLALLCGGGLLLLPPAGRVARNALSLDARTLSTNTGIDLLLGNAPGATAETDTSLDLGPYAEATRGLSEVEADRVFRRIALAWVRDHPAEAAALGLAALPALLRRDQ